MNITIVQGPFLPVPPVAGGAVEKLWFDLGREFARRGLGVTHISRSWPGLPRLGDVDGVAHRRIAGFDFPRSRVLAKVMDLVYSIRCFFAIRRCDVIVTNTFFLPVLLSLFARRGAVYVSVHRYPQGQMNLYRKVDRIQCVSSAIADAVRQQAPAVARLVKVVPNYIATRMTQSEVAASWSSRRREILFVGRIHPEKGIDLLIQAFAAIDPAARDGWSLRIVGPHLPPAGGGGEAFLASLKAMAQAAGLPIAWTGPIYDREALNVAYRRAAIFVYPSVAGEREAFPLAPLESMAQGCPVITTDLRCFSDFITPGVNASTFALADGLAVKRFADTLAQLMADEARRRAYADAGVKTVENFMLDGVADAFVDDFNSLAKP
jgi:glycosyltransferase involved in cell wall biosynthesis